jgi:hypothetical protein
MMLTIDRRWIYLALAATLIISLLLGKPVTPNVIPPVRSLFDAVDAAPAGPDDGKIILIDMPFSAGTLGENGEQARALIRHMFLRHKRFALVSVGEPQGGNYAKELGSDIAKQYGATYGTDWITFGYKYYSLAFYKSITQNIPDTIKTDGLLQEDVTRFPIMRGIHGVKNIALLIEITASSSVYDWIQLVQPTITPRLKIGYACTGVMATDAYPLLDSGQLVGLLPGLKGAADYEKLVDDLQVHEYQDGHTLHATFIQDPNAQLQLPPSARQLMYTQDKAHIVIILFIIFGNVGLLLSQRRSSAKKTREASNGGQ